MSCTAQRTSSSLQPRLPPGTQPGFDDLSHWLRPLDKTAGSKWYRAYLETVEGGDYRSPQSSVLAALATGDLRGHRLHTLGYGKLLDLSVEENSRLEMDMFPLTGRPLETMRLSADDMLDELDGIAVAWNLA
ncbi:hypothetical protein HZ326_21843 [Fusarium oxysporum f. sp. albedinis]|nr:hypothetical protein HZ326_21843 [Fusarium oxysporum f. sp. albedinis]